VSVRDPVVCIVGAGPAGLVVAHLLQRAGISFVILERNGPDELRARVKAGMLEHRTVELLRPYGLAETILGRGRRVGTCEFRADGEAFVLDYASLCGGRGHYIYPQHELVGDWAEQLLATGAEIRFGVRAAAIEERETGVQVRAEGVSTGAALTIECEVVACCDGASSVFAGDANDASVSFPFRWLTLIAAVPPSTEGTVYGLHRRGFAGQMHRSATVTRFMLEVSQNDGPDDWPDDRVWTELQDRLAVEGRPPLGRGEIIERDFLDQRVRVRDPMQSGRVFFAGDAAHLITPAGGKGMNIAIQDAAELAAGFCERFGEANDSYRLERYSETRIPHVWRQQEFSNSMLSLFNAGAEARANPEARRFSYGLRRARLNQIVADPQYSRWFARAYAGVDD
jgi:p-hydroxybenzoate 3-monooxygenase